MKMINRKKSMQSEEMMQRKELSMDELELVVGGIASKRLDENTSSSGAVTPDVCMQLQCPKCLKSFSVSSFSDSDFQRVHVDNCTGTGM